MRHSKPELHVNSRIGRRLAAPAALGLLAFATAACVDQTARAAATGEGRRAVAIDGARTGVSVSAARFVAGVGKFEDPESVRYDEEQDLFFISNMTGYGSVKDGDGYISRMSAADPSKVSVFVRGGENGVTLHSPKGLAIHGDTLWVADIDVLRGFHRSTGAPLASIDFAPHGAVLLNAIDVGPDGTLRVTDTGIEMGHAGVKYVGGDRVFMVGPNHTVSVVAAGHELRQPNGITWDEHGKRWIFVSFDPFEGRVNVMSDRDTLPQIIWRGKGRLDGLKVLHDGSIIFTSWVDSTMHRIDRKGAEKLIREIPESADFDVDTRRQRVAIPLAMLGMVQLWSIADLPATGPPPGSAPPPER